MATTGSRALDDRTVDERKRFRQHTGYLLGPTKVQLHACKRKNGHWDEDCTRNDRRTGKG